MQIFNSNTQIFYCKHGNQRISKWPIYFRFHETNNVTPSIWRLRESYESHTSTSTEIDVALPKDYSELLQQVCILVLNKIIFSYLVCHVKGLCILDIVFVWYFVIYNCYCSRSLFSVLTLIFRWYFRTKWNNIIEWNGLVIFKARGIILLRNKSMESYV